MTKHPSAQNPLTAPISFSVKSTVPIMDHKVLMSDPLTSLTPSPMILTLTYSATGTLISLLLLEHTGTCLEYTG